MRLERGVDRNNTEGRAKHDQGSGLNMEAHVMNIWLKLGVGFGVLAALAATPGIGMAADSSHPTVIELFQSQGCSSCPPAAANLAAVADRGDVLALSFEVDYWDRLGWKDTFSKHEWTERQYAYAQTMGHDGVYTPQIVVNGRAAGDGTEARAFAELVRSGERGAGGPKVGFAGNALAVGAAAAPAGGADVWLVRYIPGTVEVSVRRGENAGRTLPHKNVVRDLVSLGHWRGEAASYPLPVGPGAGLAEAAIVQTSGEGPVLAASRR